RRDNACRAPIVVVEANMRGARHPVWPRTDLPPILLRRVCALTRLHEASGNLAVGRFKPTLLARQAWTGAAPYCRTATAKKRMSTIQRQKWVGTKKNEPAPR